jgi:hypothetical protein
MGRPLTKETKSIMGIVKPVPVAPAPGVERTGGKKNRNQNKKAAAAAASAAEGGDQKSTSNDTKPTSVNSEDRVAKKAKTEAK